MNTLSIAVSLFLTISIYSVPTQSALTACKNYQDITQKNFNLSEYLGDWYEIKSYPNIFQKDMSCVKANYVLNSINVTVTNSGFNTTSNEQYVRTAFAIQNDPVNNPGRINVDFGSGEYDGEYWVIETDYNVSSLVYSCRTIGGILSESAWILSRQKTLDETLIANLNNTLYEKTGSDTTQFVVTDQDKCSGAAQTTLSLSLVALIYCILKITV